MMSIQKCAKHTLELLGPRVFWFLVLSFIAGVMLFGVELVFAYSLQVLLYALGVINTQLQVPAWLPELHLHLVLIAIFLVGSSKALLQWSQVYLQSATFEEARFLQRSRLVSHAIHSHNVSTTQVVTFYNERIGAFSSIIMNFQGLLLTFTSLVLIGASLFSITPKATFFAVTTLFVIGFFLRSLDYKIRRAASAWSDAGESANRRLLMSIKNLLLLQIYGTQSIEDAKAQKSLKDYRDQIVTFHQVIGLKASLAQIAGLALICVTAFFISRSNALPKTSLVAFFYLFVRFVQYLAESAKTIGHFSLNWPQFKEYLAWWGHHRAGNQRAADSIVQISAKAQGFVESGLFGWTLRKVIYAYPESAGPVLVDLNLEIRRGEMTAIVGPSGVGKSTLLNLIIGNIKPDQGSIEIFNDKGRLPLGDAQGALLSQIGYVGPDSFLIEGTVRQNILYGIKGDPQEAALERALLQAECSFIFDFPKKLDHILTEQGQGLSAGQKQRICLARALLRDPKALILDEATANLDRDTEDRLFETLSKLKGTMTLIVVTHKKEVLAYADQVFTLSPRV